jgi:hypothetical protein
MRRFEIAFYSYILVWMVIGVTAVLTHFIQPVWITIIFITGIAIIALIIALSEKVRDWMVIKVKLGRKK